MNILIISGYFYPENTPRSFRTTELVKQLICNGHQVKLIIPERYTDYSDFQKLYPIEMAFYKKCEGTRRFTGLSLLDRIIYRFLDQFLEYPHYSIMGALKPLLRKEVKVYDLLITIAVPHPIHWVVGKEYEKGHKLAKKWVADCGDPFMLSESRGYRPQPYFKNFETRWCRLCDYITVPTKTSYKGYYPEFWDKIKVIPQAFNFDEIVRGEYKPHTVPTFAFSGAFIPGRRDPRPILRYLVSTGQEFKAYFYTQQKALLAEFIDVLGDKLVVKDYVPRLELLKFLSTMDFLLNIENGVVAQTPSKLIDYGLTGRPILSLNSMKLNTDLLNQFMKGDYSNQYVVEDINRYNIKIVAKQFTDLAN